MTAKENNVLFDKTIVGLEGAVYYAGFRHKVIANNIANLDTPGYRALDISFRDQLECLLEAKEHRGTTKAASSRSDVSPAPPTTILTRDLNSLWPRIDRNTVSVDQELARLSQNTVFHNTCLQLLKSKLGILKSVIRDSAR
jgi:flagellar basal-body rod protein FlgB